jgi:predicted aspartyl protease
LDTGATRTLLNPVLLTALGYDLALANKRIEMTTGSGVEYAALVDIDAMTALGATKEKLPVLAHSLPPSARVDGLLGVDFFSNRRLIIGFDRGEIELI